MNKTRPSTARIKPKQSDAVPQFLKRLGVSPSEWQYTAKADLKYFMRPGHPLRIRIAACLIQQSSGYRRDVCVVQVRGERKADGPQLLPLWPAKIEQILRRVAIESYEEAGLELSDAQLKELEIDKGNIHAVLVELDEQDGFICRVRANVDTRQLIKDAVPLEEALRRKLVTPVAELSKEERGRLHRKTLIYKRTKLKPATANALKRNEDKQDEGVKIHSIAATGEERRAVQLLFRFLGRAGLPRDPMLGLNLAHREDVQSALGSYTASVRQAEESFTAFLARIAGPGTADATPAPAIAPACPQAPARRPVVEIAQPAKQRPAKGAAAELAAIAAAAASYTVFDTDAAAQLLRSCREQAPKCTAAEIAAAIEIKGKPATRKENPTGFLLVAVPRMFNGSAYAQVRELAAAKGKAAPTAAARRDWSKFRKTLEDTINNPRSSEKDKAEARQHLAELAAEAAAEVA